MSSTNRGDSRSFHVSDYYVTPIDSITKFLNKFERHVLYREYDIILDPCAGGDLENPMSYPTALKEKGFLNIKTMDIREDSLAEVKADYLTAKLDYTPFIIITNPPFAIAEDIIRKAHEDVASKGFVVMLLRLNYLEGKNRYNGLYKDIGLPNAIYLHPKRLSFTADGKTDSIAYAHFVWQKHNRVDHSYLYHVEDV